MCWQTCYLRVLIEKTEDPEVGRLREDEIQQLSIIMEMLDPIELNPEI